MIDMHNKFGYVGESILDLIISCWDYLLYSLDHFKGAKLVTHVLHSDQNSRWTVSGIVDEPETPLKKIILMPVPHFWVVQPRRHLMDTSLTQVMVQSKIQPPQQQSQGQRHIKSIVPNTILSNLWGDVNCKWYICMCFIASYADWFTFSYEWLIRLLSLHFIIIIN